METAHDGSMIPARAPYTRGVNRLPREIVTERTVLRSARPGDAPALHEAIATSRAEFFPWLSFSAKVPQLDTLERVSREAGEEFDQGTFYVWRVWEPDGSTMIGTVDLHGIDRDVPKCEVGYWLRTSHTGRGLAREAVAAVMDVARESLGAVRIEARCDPRNERSWRLAERLGFTFEGVARHDDRDAAGELCDTRVYAWIADSC